MSHPFEEKHFVPGVWGENGTCCVLITGLPLQLLCCGTGENNFRPLGATTSSKHISWLILKSRDFRDVFPRAALSEGSWPGLLAGGDFGLQAWRTSEGHGHDEMRDACLEFSVEPLCDFSGLSLSILFSISVLVVLFLFFLSEE